MKYCDVCIQIYNILSLPTTTIIVTDKNTNFKLVIIIMMSPAGAIRGVAIN